METKNRPIIVTIAGSDSSGGAGVQADLLAITAQGGYGATVISALTAQNTCGVFRVDPVEPSMVQAQIDAVMGDLPVAALKTGMLPTVDIVTHVVAALRRYRPRVVVCDPVMVASTGAALVNESAIATMREHLFPMATVVTPNIPELEVLAQRSICDVADAIAAAQMLCARLGYQAVLIKGGHWPQYPVADGACADVLVMGDQIMHYPGERLDVRHTHGTGCILSAGIATQLAHGADLPEAVRCAKAFVTEAIRWGAPVGEGVGPADPMFVLRKGTVDCMGTMLKEQV